MEIQKKIVSKQKGRELELIEFLKLFLKIVSLILCFFLVGAFFNPRELTKIVLPNFTGPISSFSA